MIVKPRRVLNEPRENDSVRLNALSDVLLERVLQRSSLILDIAIRPFHISIALMLSDGRVLKHSLALASSLHAVLECKSGRLLVRLEDQLPVRQAVQVIHDRLHHIVTVCLGARRLALQHVRERPPRHPISEDDDRCGPLLVSLSQEGEVCAHNCDLTALLVPVESPVRKICCRAPHAVPAPRLPWIVRQVVKLPLSPGWFDRPGDRANSRRLDASVRLRWWGNSRLLMIFFWNLTISSSRWLSLLDVPATLSMEAVNLALHHLALLARVLCRIDLPQVIVSSVRSYRCGRVNQRPGL